MESYGADQITTIEKSSLIEAVGTRGDWLIVWFKRGGAYRYRNAARMHDSLVSSESVGKTFHQEVRNAFGAEKLGLSWPDE